MREKRSGLYVRNETLIANKLSSCIVKRCTNESSLGSIPLLPTIWHNVKGSKKAIILENLDMTHPCTEESARAKNKKRTDNKTGAFMLNKNYLPARMMLEKMLGGSTDEGSVGQTFIDLHDGGVLVATHVMQMQHYDWSNQKSNFVRRRGASSKKMKKSSEIAGVESIAPTYE